MRTTIVLDDKLLGTAREVTRISDRTVLVHEGLKALIERECARRLAEMAGSMPRLEPITRRRQRYPGAKARNSRQT